MSTTVQDTNEGLSGPYSHQQHANMFVGAMAKNYTSRTGGCNVQLATRLISLSIPYLPSQKGTLIRILDNACGPLVLTTEILKTPAITSAYRPIHISAVDLSADFIRDNNSTIATNAATMDIAGAVKVDSAVMDGMALDFADDTFDASFTSLGIFAFPDPVKGATELHRTLKPSGVATLTTWKHVSWVKLLHEVERAIKPAGNNSPPTRFPIVEAWMVPGKLSACLRDGGFREVEEGEVQAVAWYEDFKTMARSLTDTLRMMVGDGWTEGEKERMEAGFLDCLREKEGKEDRGAAEGLRFEEGGRVGMEMCAFTAVARK